MTTTRKDVEKIRRRWKKARFDRAVEALDFTMESDTAREIDVLMRGPGDIAALLEFIDALGGVE